MVTKHRQHATRAGGKLILRSVTNCGFWEGEAPSEPHASTRFRLGRSLALPKRRASVFGRAEYHMLTSAILGAALLAVLTVLTAAPVQAQKPVQAQDEGLGKLGEGVGLTVYNQNLAIVRQRRIIDLKAGRSEVKFKDVTATIVPETVQFRSLSPAGDATVIEQNYEFDLVNAGKLLNKYIDKQIGLVTRDGDLIEGRLLSFDNAQLVLANQAGLEMIPRGKNVKDIRFSALPGGFLTRPTLVWQVKAQHAGPHLVQVAYRANQINWRVDYRAVTDPQGKLMDLSGWVTVNNRSGMTYRNARLKLMAGDVHVVEEV